MQITLDETNSRYQIRAYSNAEIQVNEIKYSHSIIITPDLLISPWEVSKVNHLRIEHFAAILRAHPEIILLGTGIQLQFPPPELLQSLTHANIGLEIMDTGAACRTYQVLISEGRSVAAALMIHQK